MTAYSATTQAKLPNNFLRLLNERRARVATSDGGVLTGHSSISHDQQTITLTIVQKHINSDYTTNRRIEIAVAHIVAVEEVR